MKRSYKLAKGAAVVALTAAVSAMGAGVAMADTVSAFWGNPTEASTIDNNALKTYGVRAGSAGGDFLGIANTNFDFNGGSASQTTQYTGYTAASLSTAYTGSGLAIWATSVNESVNPYYANLWYDTINGTSYAKATTWMSNPNSWGDSNGSASTVQIGTLAGTSTIAGLEYLPDIIHGAEKMTNWSNWSVTDTNMYTGIANLQNAGLTDYNPTFTNNDSTNIWSQVYSIGKLAVAADGLTAGTDKYTRYDNSNAYDTALAYEKVIKGNLLYCASKIDNGAKKKTVAYLYGICDGKAYFFTPQADGLLEGDDDGAGVEGTEAYHSYGLTNYAGNNGTIDLGYMATLPFITNTFTTDSTTGINMTVEDIVKTNPACIVAADASADALAGVDVIIYNTATGALTGSIDGTTLVKDETLTASNVSEWAAKYGFAGNVLAGDDWATAKNQAQGLDESATTVDGGTSPLLYCMRNYTVDKNARAAWAFAKVYPEFYGGNSNATYAYWVDNIYHINDESVSAVASYMTKQASGAVEYTADTEAALEADYEAGLKWWNETGSKSETWSKFAYYNGSSRASYYSGNEDADEPEDTIGIMAPSTLWQNSKTILAAEATLASATASEDGSDVAPTAKWVTAETYNTYAATVAAYKAGTKTADELTAATETYTAAQQAGTKAIEMTAAKNVTIGQEIKVSINATGEFASLQGVVDYDDEVFDLVKIEAGSDLSDGVSFEYDATGKWSVYGNEGDLSNGGEVAVVTLKAKGLAEGSEVEVKDLTGSASGSMEDVDPAGDVVYIDTLATYTLGDVNNNTKVNIVDAQIVLDMSNNVYGTEYETLLDQLETAGTTWNYPTLFAAADANQNGTVDSVDARAIQHKVHTGNFA